MNDDRISEVYKGEIWTDEAQARARRRIDWMCSAAVGDTVLDIGCSQGIASILLGREGFQVTGIDVQADRIEYALADLAKESPGTQARVSFEVGEGGELRFDDSSFDTVLIGEVIEHLAQPGRLLAEAARVLKPGGRVALTTPFGSLHHHDHRQTFFPRQLIDLISTHFGIAAVGIEDRYFRVVATSDPSPALEPAEALAQLEAAADRTVSGIQDELADFKRRNLRSQRDMAAALRREQSLQTELASMSKRADEAKKLRSEIERLTASVGATQRQLRSSQEKLGSSEQQLRTSKENLGAANARIRTLESKVKSNHARLETKAAKLSGRIRTLQERIHKLEGDRWKLRHSLAVERWRLRSMRNRKWWRIGGLLAAVRRKPWRIFVLPFDVVSLAAGTSTKVPRPLAPPKPQRSVDSSEGKVVESTKTSAKPTSATAVVPHGHRHAPSPSRLLVVAAILDSEASASFAHEWQLFDLTPDTWRSVLDEQRPELLVVDVASDGRDGSWGGKFGGTNSLSIDVAQLLEAFGSAGIPRLMIADHPASDVQANLGTAAYFDAVASYDPETVAAYASAGMTASLLPPGVQTMRYNPVGAGARQGDLVIVDDGDLPVSLGPAAKAATEFSLRIHSVGNAGTIIWPSEFSESVSGEYTWDEAPDIAKAYKIALAPIGDTRPSSSALRAAAAGTPIISLAGSSSTLPHLAPSDDKEARTLIRYLLRSDDERTRLGHLAMRTAVREFPLSRTADAALRAVDLDATPPPRPHVTIMAPTNRPQQVEAILHNVARQTYRDLDLVIVHHGFDVDETAVTDRAAELGIPEVSFVDADESVPAGEVFNRGFRAAKGDLIAKMDDDDHYGAEYLSDQVDAFDYTEADIVGKWAHYTYLEDLDTTILRYPQHEHEYRDVLAISTLLIKRHIFETVEFPPMPVGSGSVFLREVGAHGGRIYSADRFNYLYVRYAQNGHHTFPVSAFHLAANALTVCRGRNVNQVEI